MLSGQGLVSVGDLERLANQLRIPDPDYHAALFALRKDIHKRGFWNTGYRRAYSHEPRLRVDLEMHADRIREFEVEVVPDSCNARSTSALSMRACSGPRAWLWTRR